MKRSCKSVLVVAGLSVFVAGCVTRTVYVRQPPPPAAAVEPPPVSEPPGDVVAEAPPPPKVEVQVVAPGPDYVWTPGYWAWHGGWVWVGGRWALPPRRHAFWVGGHWARRGRGYVWIGGRWR